MARSDDDDVKGTVFRPYVQTICPDRASVVLLVQKQGYLDAKGWRSDHVFQYNGKVGCDTVAACQAADRRYVDSDTSDLSLHR